MLRTENCCYVQRYSGPSYPTCLVYYFIYPLSSIKVSMKGGFQVKPRWRCVVTIIQKLDFDRSWLLLQLFIPPLQLIQTCWSSWCCKWWGDVLRIVRGRSTVFPSFGDELIMRGRIGDELTVERSIVFPEVLSPSSAGVPSWVKYVQSFWDYSFVINCLCVLYYVTIFHSKRY